MSAALALDLAPPGPQLPGFRAHALHAADRAWPETNCYVDLWIELLHARGLVPEAMLGFTLRQDFEGDQFTFFKPHATDIERLYGLEVQELAVYDSLEGHALVQIARGRTVLVEVDGFFLPDTPAATYRREHGKTTIAILALDPEARTLEYLHNAGRFRLSGADYDGVFAAQTLFPYAEFVKEGGAPLPPAALHGEALALLRAHRRRAPAENPWAAFRDALARDGERRVAGTLADFHHYAFNTTRQAGACAELLASHLDWLGGFADAADHARALAGEARAFQFQLARAYSRRSAAGLPARLDKAVASYDALFAALDRALLAA